MCFIFYWSGGMVKKFRFLYTFIFLLHHVRLIIDKEMLTLVMLVLLIFSNTKIGFYIFVFTTYKYDALMVLRWASCLDYWSRHLWILLVLLFECEQRGSALLLCPLLLVWLFLFFVHAECLLSQTCTAIVTKSATV